MMKDDNFIDLRTICKVNINGANKLNEKNYNYNDNYYLYDT